MKRRVVVAGIGNDERGDDAVGPVVARTLQGIGHFPGGGPGHFPGGGRGEPCVAVVAVGSALELLEHWEGAELAVVIDALHSGGAPGAVVVAELGTGAAAAGGRGRGGGRGGSGPDTKTGGLRCTSTHGIGLEAVLGLAGVLGRAPRRVVLVGVEGASFGVQRGLSPAVAGAVDRAGRAVLTLVAGARWPERSEPV